MYPLYKKTSIPIRILRPTTPMSEYKVVIEAILEGAVGSLDAKSSDIYTYHSAICNFFNKSTSAISVMEIISSTQESDIIVQISDYGNSNISIGVIVNKPIVIH